MRIDELVPSYLNDLIEEALTHDDDCDCDLCTLLYDVAGPSYDRE